jgi:hypothetical protein
VEDGLDELDGELDFVNEAIPPLSVKPHCLIMNEPLDDDDEHRPLPGKDFFRSTNPCSSVIPSSVFAGFHC